MSRTKKTVAFAPDTHSGTGRIPNKFWRIDALYSPGKYALPEDSDGYLDTSSAYDVLQHILNLKVFGTYRVCNEEEVDILRDALNTLWKVSGTGESAIPDSLVTLHDHPFCWQVMEEYQIFRERHPDHPELNNFKKGVVVYESYEGEYLGYGFVEDPREDCEAHEYIRAMQTVTPPGNVGRQVDVTLRLIREAWRGEKGAEDVHSE